MYSLNLKLTLCVLVTAIIVLVANIFFPILRDIPASGVTRGQRSPYSLARMQMAFWTVVIVGSLIYLYWFGLGGSGEFPTIDNNLVILMGISGATGVVAAAIDIGKDATVEGTEAQFAGTSEAISALDAQILAVASDPATLTTDPTLAKLFADRAAKMEELARQQRVLTRSRRADDTGATKQAEEAWVLQTMPSMQKRSLYYVTRFFKDLLEDQNGNSLHRLQLLFFTVIYGSYVLSHVASAGANKMLTALDDGLIDPAALALLGVSGTIYVGFKAPGKAESATS